MTGATAVNDHAVLTDSELLRAIRDGDVGAWNTVVDRYSEVVWSAISASGLDLSLAAEVFRLTWMRFRDLVDLEWPTVILGWLQQTAQRESKRAAAFALAFS